MSSNDKDYATACNIGVAVLDDIECLYDSWQSNKDIKSFDDYQERGKKLIEVAGGSYITMTKRPFQVSFKVSSSGLFAVRVSDKRTSIHRVS